MLGGGAGLAGRYRAGNSADANINSVSNKYVKPERCGSGGSAVL